MDRGAAPGGPGLTSKVFHPVARRRRLGSRAGRVRRVVRESLERLGVERIDVYLVHEPDPATPLADTLAALEELVEDGAIGAIGVSNVDGDYLAEAVELAPIAVVQNEYSLLVRDAERECFRSAPSTASSSRPSARSPAAG